MKLYSANSSLDKIRKGRRVSEKKRKKKVRGRITIYHSSFCSPHLRYLIRSFSPMPRSFPPSSSPPPTKVHVAWLKEEHDLISYSTIHGDEVGSWLTKRSQRTRYPVRNK